MRRLAITVIPGSDAPVLCIDMAEREGFEPPIRLPVCRISSAVHSTALPPLRSRSSRAEYLAKRRGRNKSRPPRERGRRAARRRDARASLMPLFGPGDADVLHQLAPARDPGLEELPERVGRGRIDRDQAHPGDRALRKIFSGSGIKWKVPGSSRRWKARRRERRQDAKS